MSRDIEAAALAWLDRHLRTHICPDCGGIWITRRTTTSLFHQCQPKRTTLYDWRPPQERYEAEREAWARKLLGPVTSHIEDEE